MLAIPLFNDAVQAKKVSSSRLFGDPGRSGEQEELVAELEENMKYVDGEIEGVVIPSLKFFHDKRGWLVEIFRHDELEQDCWPTMMYVSSTLPGVARGPTSTWTRPTASRSSGHLTSGFTSGMRGRTARRGHRKVMTVGASNPPRSGFHRCRSCLSQRGRRPALVFNAPNRLYAGWGKKEPVDEIRHEDADPPRFILD